MTACDLLRAAAGLGFTAWTGGCVSCALWPRLRAAPAAARLALGFGAGAGILAGGMFLLGVAGVPFSAPLLLGIQAAFAAAAALGYGLAGGKRGGEDPRGSLLLRCGRALLPFTPAEVEPLPVDAPPPASGSARAGATLLLCLAALVLAGTAALSVEERAAFTDARTVWMLKARVFHLDRGFGGIYFEEWTDPAERRTYPPLFPLCGAYIHFLCGHTADGAVKLLQAAFAAGLCTLLYLLLAPRTGPSRAAAAVLLFTLCGQTVTLTVWGTADLGLAFFLFAALWVLDHAGEEGRARPAAGFFCACAAFTKNEGALGWICLSAAALLVPPPPRGAAAGAGGGKGKKRTFPWRRLPGLLAPPLAAVLAWRLFCAHLGLVGHFLEKAPLEKLVQRPGLLLDRLAVTAAFYAREFASPRWLLAWPPFFLAAGAFLIRRRTPAAGAGGARAAVFVLLLLAVDAGVYLFLSPKVEWYTRTSIGRLFFHAFPAAYAFIVLEAVAAGRRAPPRPP